MKTTRINQTTSVSTFIDFGVTDLKGRAVGFVGHASEFDAVETTADYGYNAGEPGHYFHIRGISTRNRRSYGSADIVVQGTSKTVVDKEFAARVERARKAAVKKFAAK